MLIILVLITNNISAQFVPYQSGHFKRLAADTLYNLTNCGAPAVTPNSYRRVVWYYDSCNQINYYWQPENQVWAAITGGGGGDSSLTWEQTLNNQGATPFALSHTTDIGNKNFVLDNMGFMQLISKGTTGDSLFSFFTGLGGIGFGGGSVVAGGGSGITSYVDGTMDLRATNNGSPNYFNQQLITKDYIKFSKTLSSGVWGTTPRNPKIVYPSDTLLTAPEFVYVSDNDTIKKYPFPTGGGSGGDSTLTWEQTLNNQGALPFTSAHNTDLDANNFTLSNANLFTINTNTSNSPYSSFQVAPTYHNLITAGDSTEASALVQNSNTPSTANAELRAVNTNTSRSHIVRVNLDSVLIQGSLSGVPATDLRIRGLPYGNDTSSIKPMVVGTDGKVYQSSWYGSGGGLGARDTAYFFQGYGLSFNNLEGYYKPNGFNVVGAVDTTVIATKQDINIITNTDTAVFIVDSIANAPTGSEPANTKYLVGTSPTGLFATHANDIAELIGAVWTFTDPTAQQQLIVDNAVTYATYQFDGALWNQTSILWRVNGNTALGQNAFLGKISKERMPFRSWNKEFMYGDTTRDVYLPKLINTPSFNYLRIDSITGRIDTAMFRPLIAGTNITITAGPVGDTISSTGTGGGSTGGIDSLRSVTKVNGATPYYTSIGDSTISTVPPTQVIVFFGTSITNGCSPSAPMGCIPFRTLTAFYAHANQVNRGVNATTMEHNSGVDSCMIDRIYLIPTYSSSYKAIVFEYGINDAYSVAWADTAAFRAAYYRVIDTCIARGWPLNRIEIMTVGYYNYSGANQGRRQDYTNVIKSIATAKGVGLGDIDKLFVSEGRQNSSVMYTDSLHPNTLGNQYWARAALDGLGFKHAQFLNVNGNVTTNYLTLRQSNANKAVITIEDTIAAPLMYLRATDALKESLYFGSTNLTGTGINNNSFGHGSLQNITTGQNNTAIGRRALYANTTGNYNTAIGTDAIAGSTTSSDNVAIGYHALLSPSFTGTENIAIGNTTMQATTSGFSNIGVGHGVLLNQTSGLANIAMGSNAMEQTTSGGQNVAIGHRALNANTTASAGVAIGSYSQRLGTGGGNVSVGQQTLYDLTGGQGNTAIGTFALIKDIGDNNTALGWSAGRYDAPGTSDNVSSANSVYIGYDTRSLANGGSNETVIGYLAKGNGSNTTTIGNASTTDTWFGGTTKLHITLGAAPASASATGVTGTVIITADFIYVCTATNTWKRTALATW